MKLRALLAVAALAACSKSEGELVRDDRAALGVLVQHDVRASQAMRDADRAVRTGDLPGALRAIDDRALPAVEAGLAASSSLSLKTDWGRARRDAVASVLRDRKVEMPRYVEALRSDDAERLLAAVEAQAALERRALAAVAAIEEQR